MLWKGSFRLTPIGGPRDSIECAIHRKVLRPACAGLRMTSLRRLGTTGNLDFAPQFCSRVFRIQLRQFAKEFLGPLVSRHWDVDGDFHDFVAADAFFCRRRNSLFPQAQLLARLRAGRNLQQSPAINCGDFYLCSQSRFSCADRNGERDVVAVTVKDRMVAGADNGVEVTRGAAVGSGVPLAGDADALPVASAGLDANFK